MRPPQRPPQAWHIPGKFTRCKLDFRGSHVLHLRGKVTPCAVITGWWLQGKDTPTVLAALIFVYSSSVFEVPVGMDVQ